ncbi:hypothetical protein Efla_000747 [Eimeria flavescens]
MDSPPLQLPEASPSAELFPPQPSGPETGPAAHSSLPSGHHSSSSHPSFGTHEVLEAVAPATHRLTLSNQVSKAPAMTPADEELVRFVVHHLRGDALLWLELSESNRSQHLLDDWTAFKSALRGRFVQWNAASTDTQKLLYELRQIGTADLPKTVNTLSGCQHSLEEFHKQSLALRCPPDIEPCTLSCDFSYNNRPPLIPLPTTATGTARSCARLRFPPSITTTHPCSRSYTATLNSPSSSGTFSSGSSPQEVAQTSDASTSPLYPNPIPPSSHVPDSSEEPHSPSHDAAAEQQQQQPSPAARAPFVAVLQQPSPAALAAPPAAVTAPPATAAVPPAPAATPAPRADFAQLFSAVSTHRFLIWLPTSWHAAASSSKTGRLHNALGPEDAPSDRFASVRSDGRMPTVGLVNG